MRPLLLDQNHAFRQTGVTMRFAFQVNVALSAFLSILGAPALLFPLVAADKPPVGILQPVSDRPPIIISHGPPTLWRDREAAEVVQALDYGTYVFRWKNTAVEGWVEFDGDGGPRRVPLGTGLDAAKE